MYYSSGNDTICALSTPAGMGPIAILRLSGPDAFRIIDEIFHPAEKTFSIDTAPSHSVHFGSVGIEGNLLDEVLVTLFKNPHSYTGEDVAEISCHGSTFIQQKLLELLYSKGARQAGPGEFTLRAFMNRKFDLSQAEAVADLIASHSEASHDLAMSQMRGGYSKKIRELRTKLLDFASLIELELDFSEEDVEFANRPELQELLSQISEEIEQLVKSFSLGNVIKHGIPVTIIGKPNVGKSTLLNAILNEEKAIVSEIPGTTRDAIEDTIVIGGYSFRFIDTAGLRESEDTIETMGIERTWEKIHQAAIILYVFDATQDSFEEVMAAFPFDKLPSMNSPSTPSTPSTSSGADNESTGADNESSGAGAGDDKLPSTPSTPSTSSGADNDKLVILVGNKTDQLEKLPTGFRGFSDAETIFVSAKRKENIHLLAESLLKYAGTRSFTGSTVVSNARHLEALRNAAKAIDSVKAGLSASLSSDLLAPDIRLALHHLGEITGEITTDDILGNIFGKFCVGK